MYLINFFCGFFVKLSSALSFLEKWTDLTSLFVEYSPTNNKVRSVVSIQLKKNNIYIYIITCTASALSCPVSFRVMYIPGITARKSFGNSTTCMVLLSQGSYYRIRCNISRFSKLLLTYCIDYLCPSLMYTLIVPREPPGKKRAFFQK